MGREFARRLEAAGYELVLWNRSPGPAAEFAARGATVVGSPAEAATEAPIRLTMLADGPAVDEVTSGPEGLLEGDPGGTLIEMSTIDIATSRRLAEAADRAGIAYLRAPVSGNPSVVAAGNLTILISGPRPAIGAVREILAAIGPNLMELGDGEEARVMKLVLNLILGGTTELLAEALVLAEASGLDRERALMAIGESAIGSPFIAYKREAIVARDYAPTFTIANLSKDLGLILDQGRAEGVPLPATAAIAELVAECEREGMAGQDMLALIPRLERAAGRDGAAQ